MTHNQIDYWNLVENRRHNQAGEKINQQEADTRSGTLAEMQRHNIAEEGLSLASIGQQERASERAASAQMYSSDNALYASKYSSDINAATQRYGYDLNAATQRYSADLSAKTQQYVSDNQRFSTLSTAQTNREIQKYNADTNKSIAELQATTTRRGQDFSFVANEANNLTSMLGNITSLANGGLGFLGKTIGGSK